jgi:hypothetical protein
MVEQENQLLHLLHLKCMWFHKLQLKNLHHLHLTGLEREKDLLIQQLQLLLLLKQCHLVFVFLNFLNHQHHHRRHLKLHHRHHPQRLKFLLILFLVV